MRLGLQSMTIRTCFILESNALYSSLFVNERMHANL